MELLIMIQLIYTDVPNYDPGSTTITTIPPATTTIDAPETTQDYGLTSKKKFKQFNIE